MNAPLNVVPSSLDPYMPLESSGTYHHQMEGGNEKWHEASPQGLAEMLDGENSPMFRTILSQSPDGFAGPFYADFDGELEEVLFMANAFMDKVEARGLPEDVARIFLTGGRGVHIEIRQACFMAEPGFVHDLPKVYREMAQALWVDTMDLRVYSGREDRKARQWRVPHVKRENGAYKVPVSREELRTCTVEMFREYCSKPRPFPALNAPTSAPGLAALFESCLAKVQAKAGAVRTYTKAESEIRSRFAGKFPASMDLWLSGQALSDAGWNDISLQLGASAVAFGVDTASALAQCAGLIEAHESDGKYNTPTKRTRRLEEMIEYCADGDYSFSVPALLSVVPNAIKPALRADFAGIEADSDGTDYVELLDAVKVTKAPDQVRQLAQQINADSSLGAIGQKMYLKQLARVANVPLSVLQADVYDASDDGRPSVMVNATDFAGSVASAKAVLPLIDSVRSRIGKLVQVLPNKTIHELEPGVLAELISGVAVWRSGDGAKRGPDSTLMTTVLGSGYWQGVREFVGFAEQPTLLPDNTIGLPLNYEPAYDPADFPKFEGSGADAMKLLESLLVEFPFVSEQDRSMTLAAILTAVIRPTLKRAPAFLFTATRYGSGKTYLASLVKAFGTAKQGVFAAPRNTQELDKAVLPYFLDPDPVIIIDNMTCDLSGREMASALTEPWEYTGRLMGTSTPAKVSSRKLVMATGENVEAGKDLLRRVVHVRLAGC